MLLIQVVAGRVPSERLTQPRWRWPPPGGVARAGILSGLERSGGKHLIFVRYDTRHDTGDEWVYNSADIDRQRLIWARDLGDDRNMELIRYYPGRHFWILDADQDPPRVGPAVVPARRL